MAPPQQHRGSGRSAGNKDGRSRDVLPGPKNPPWCCNCGEDHNWACRIRCKGCGGKAPQTVFNKATAAAGQAPNRSAVGRQQSSGAAPGCPTQSSRDAKVRLELEALRKENEALKKLARAPVRPATAVGTAKDVADSSDDTAMGGAAEELAKQIKDQRAKIKALERTDEIVKNEMGHIFEVRFNEAAALLDELLQRKQQAKPVDVQLKAALHNRDRCARNKERHAEAVVQMLQEQTEVAAKLLALQKAAGAALADLATAEEAIRRLQAAPATAPAVPVPVGPMVLSLEVANKLQAWVDGAGSVPPDFIDALTFAFNSAFTKPPGAVPAAGAQIAQAGVNSAEAAAPAAGTRAAAAEAAAAAEMAAADAGAEEAHARQAAARTVVASVAAETGGKGGKGCGRSERLDHPYAAASNLG